MDPAIFELAQQNNQLEEDAKGILHTVRKVIDEEYGDDEAKRQDMMSRVMFYITQQEMEEDHRQACPVGVAALTLHLPPIFHTLKTAIRRETLIYLKAYVRLLYKKQMEQQDQTPYEQWKRRFFDGCVDALVPPEGAEEDEEAANIDEELRELTGSEMAADVVKSVISRTTRWVLKYVVGWTETMIKREVASCLDELLRVVGKSSWNQFATVCASFLGHVGFTIVVNLWHYFVNGRSMKRVMKNVIDNVATFGAQLIVGYGVVALIGLIFGPLGFWAGVGVSVVAGFPAAYVTRKYVDKWTLELFDLPKSEALEKAYRTLGLTKSASDEEVSQAASRICAENHPDHLEGRVPPPSEKEIEAAVERFIECQRALEFIRMARQMQEANGGEEVVEGEDNWQANFMEFFKNFVRINLDARAKFVAEEAYQQILNSVSVTNSAA